MPGECGHCGKPNAVSICGGCKAMFYCNGICQRAHWKKGHKKQCKQLQSKNLHETRMANTDILYDTISKQQIANILSKNSKSQPRERLFYILQIYDNWINLRNGDLRNKCKPSFGELLQNDFNYFHHNILNDFHLVLLNKNDKPTNNTNHDNQECKSNHCQYVTRNNRDRNMVRKTDEINSRKKMYFDYQDSMNCTLFQTLDAIHCALYHTDINRNNLNDKFIINVSKSIEDNDNIGSDEKVNTNDHQSYHNFGFGESFMYYHNTLPGHKGMEVTPHFASLKQELLNNPYYRFTETEYNDFRVKAYNIQKTPFIRNIKGYLSGEAQWIGIKKGDHMTIDHIISLLIYCNETEAQKIFKQQCRRKNANETTEELIKRHSYIAHWMRYLWDATKIYGTELRENEIVWTGMSHKLLFTSFSNLFYAPLSTSSSSIVARNFATNDGIVLKLKSTHQNARYFNMMPISDFVHEKEKFFISAELNIVDIIIDRSYFVEVCALKLMEKIIRGELFYNNCNLQLIANNVQNQLIEFMDNYLQKKNYEDNVNLNYFQTMFNNMISSYMIPENYEAEQLQKFENDLILFIDREEIEKLNAKLCAYFFTKNAQLNNQRNNKKSRNKKNKKHNRKHNNKKKSHQLKSNNNNNNKYGPFLNKVNIALHFASKHVTLNFNRKQIKELKHGKQLIPGINGYCLNTKEFVVLHQSSKGMKITFIFSLLFNKHLYPDGELYEISLMNLSKPRHEAYISMDYHVEEIKYEHHGIRFMTNGAYHAFVGFPCSKLKNITSKLTLTLNFKIIPL